jgi:hypothetical protein
MFHFEQNCIAVLCLIDIVSPKCVAEDLPHDRFLNNQAQHMNLQHYSKPHLLLSTIDRLTVLRMERFVLGRERYVRKQY